MPELFSPNRKKMLGWLVLIGAAQAASMLVLALLLKTAIGGIDTSPAVGPSAMIFALILANALLGVMKWREHVVSERLGQDYIKEVRVKAFAHLSTMSLHAQSQFRGGSLQLRFVNDLAALRQWVALGVARLIVAGITTGIALAILVVLDPALGGLLLAVCGLGVAIALVLGRAFDARIREARRRRGHIAANIGEKINNMVVVQAFANIKRERRKVRQQANRLQDAMLDRASTTGLFRGAMLFVVSLGIVAVVGVSTLQSSDPISALQRMTVALTLLSLLSPSLFQLGRVYEYYKGATIAHEKLSKMFGRGPLILPAPSPQRMPRKFRKLEFRDVSVKGILRSVSFELGAKDRVVLQGANGSGKSTLINLMVRLVEPDSGQVMLNGIAVDELRTGQLRRMISVISPDLPLFKGTVASNIAYGSAKAGDEQAQAAAALCHMDCDNPKSPFFLGRRVSEAGKNLSAGEKMRIIIARALVGSPKLLLLDEPDSHLDRATQSVLRSILNDFAGGWLLVSHGHLASEVSGRRWFLENQTLREKREVKAA